MSASEAASAADRALAWIDALALCTDEPGRITRLAFSPALAAANALVLDWMGAAGMTARIDAAGNVIGRYEGVAPGAPAFMLGSHLDTVRDGGRFDGPLGVVAAILAVDRLRRAGRRLTHAVEIAAFADEEGVRFDGTVLGSAALAGMPPPAWQERRDESGVTAAMAVAAFGLDPGRVDEASRRADPPVAYVELHIEQGPILEAADQPLGCVTAIAGATRLGVTLTGAAGHAGTVPMQGRQDALAAAAECVLAVERLCAQPGVVGTVGRLIVAPNASNVIPGSVDFSLDIRSGADSHRRSLVEAVMREIESIAVRRRTANEVRAGSETSATPCDPGLVVAITRTLSAMGLDAPRLTSGAGHDGISMSAICPVGMIFLRCAGGISHNPAEDARASDIGLGIDALHDLLVRNFA